MKVDPKRRVDYEGITTCSSGRSFLKPPPGAMSPSGPPASFASGSLFGTEPLYSRQRTQPVRSSISSARAQMATGASSSVHSFRSSKPMRLRSSVETYRSAQQTTPEPARLRSVRKRPGEEQVLAEYIVEHEVKIPKKMTREDVIERTYVVPERVVVEEIVEENTKIVERVIEVAQPIVMEKVVEVPEIEYVEKIVEVPQRITREKVREVPKIQYEERIIEVSKLVPREKIVNVPVYEYHDLPFEKIVEVPQIHEQVRIKEVPIPQYVDKPVAEERTIQIDKEVPRITPVPVEAVTTLSLTLPKIRSVWKQHKVPVYVPRFVEIPIAAELCNEQLLDDAHRCVNEVTKLMAASQVEPLSACKLEECAGFIQNYEFSELIGKQSSLENFAHWWVSNQLQIDEGSLQSICQTLESDNTVFTEAVSLIKPRSSESKTAATTVTTTTTSGQYPFVGGGNIIRVSETPSSIPGPLESINTSEIHTEITANAHQQHQQMMSMSHMQTVTSSSSSHLQGTASNMALDPKTGCAMLVFNRQILQPNFPNMSVLRSAELLNSPLGPVSNRPPPELGSNSSVASDIKCVAADNPTTNGHHSSEASEDDYNKVEMLNDGVQTLNDQQQQRSSAHRIPFTKDHLSAEHGRMVRRGEMEELECHSVEDSVEYSIQQRAPSMDISVPEDEGRSMEDGHRLVEDCVDADDDRPIRAQLASDATPPLRATSVEEDESVTKETPVSSPDEEELPLISTLHERTSEEADYDDEED